MLQVFKMTDLGKMSFFLNEEIKQKNGETFISKRKYAQRRSYAKMMFQNKWRKHSTKV